MFICDQSSSVLDNMRRMFDELRKLEKEGKREEHDKKLEELKSYHEQHQGGLIKYKNEPSDARTVLILANHYQGIKYLDLMLEKHVSPSLLFRLARYLDKREEARGYLYPEDEKEYQVFKCNLAWQGCKNLFWGKIADHLDSTYWQLPRGKRKQYEERYLGKRG